MQKNQGLTSKNEKVICKPRLHEKNQGHKSRGKKDIYTFLGNYCNLWQKDQLTDILTKQPTKGMRDHREITLLRIHHKNSNNALYWTSRCTGFE